FSPVCFLAGPGTRLVDREALLRSWQSPQTLRSGMNFLWGPFTPACFDGWLPKSPRLLAGINHFQPDDEACRTYDVLIMSRRESQLRLQKLAESVVRKSREPNRHKSFVSYQVTNEDEVATFLEDYGMVFIPTVVGITEDDDFVDSADTDYIMDR